MFTSLVAAIPPPRQMPACLKVGTQLGLCTASLELSGRSKQATSTPSRFVHQRIQGLSDALNLRLHIDYLAPLQATGLFVANHISWIDAVALLQLADFSFIAKEEVADWPIVGRAAAKMNSVFIQRQNKFAVYRSLPTLTTALARGQRLLVFPEGTTTAQPWPGHFHPMLFECATRSRQTVQPLSIRYTNRIGEPLPDVAFVDDDTVLASLSRILQHDEVHCRIQVLPAVDDVRCRKQAALRCHERICASLRQ